jgi:hypothetical protein
MPTKKRNGTRWWVRIRGRSESQAGMAVQMRKKGRRPASAGRAGRPLARRARMTLRELTGVEG